MAVKDFSAIRNSGKLPSPYDIDQPSVPDLLGDYIESAQSSVEMLEGLVLTDPKMSMFDENIAQAKRILHSMKGEAGILGLNDIYQLCHETENAIEEVSEELSYETILRFSDWVLKAINYLKTGKIEQNDQFTDEQDRPAEKPLKILVVEDDLACATAIKGYLMEYAVCTVAENGLEAIQQFHRALDYKAPFDLICMDINMPKMNGTVALETIREIEKERNINGLDGVKVIMVTVNDDSGNIFGSFRKGCEAYIVKPVSKEKIVHELKALNLIKG